MFSGPSGSICSFRVSQKIHSAESGTRGGMIVSQFLELYGIFRSNLSNKLKSEVPVNPFYVRRMNCLSRDKIATLLDEVAQI